MARGARRRPQPERLQLALAEFRLGIRLAREDLTVLAERLDDSPPGSTATRRRSGSGPPASTAPPGRRCATYASLADVMAVHSTAREARFHLARAEALGYDEEPPTSSEPCWFDPQHGPATAEVDWRRRARCGSAATTPSGSPPGWPRGAVPCG